MSPEVRDELVEVGVAPASRFAVVRLGIELSERMAGASGGASLRASLGIPEDRFCVGWVARMSAVKQPEDVLRVIRELRDRGVDAALILIGDGPERDGLEQRARELDLVEGVHFVGFQNDVGPWFHAFDVLLLTSRSEGTPVSAIETLASGRPVVATDVGGTRDVVSEGVSGFLVPFGDVSAAAERLERLARDPGSSRDDGCGRPGPRALVVRGSEARRRHRSPLSRAARRERLRRRPDQPGSVGRVEAHGTSTSEGGRE